MPASPTPGELAYLAYWRRWPATPLPWSRLSTRERRAWDAAAHAAIAAWQTRQVPGTGQERRAR